MNLSFTVIARCKIFEKGLDESYDVKEDIELEFDREKALKFLLRFSESAMIIGEYKMMFKYNDKHLVTGIVLFKQDKVYMVTNTQQVVSDIIKGYEYLVTMDKVSDIMSFDFNAAMDFSDVEDEFD